MLYCLMNNTTYDCAAPAPNGGMINEKWVLIYYVYDPRNCNTAVLSISL
jgi:hypothetical protein